MVYQALSAQVAATVLFRYSWEKYNYVHFGYDRFWELERNHDFSLQVKMQMERKADEGSCGCKE